MAAAGVRLKSIDGLIRGKSGYQVGDMRVSHGPDDRILAYLYERFYLEGTLDIIFYESRPRLVDFLTMFMDPATSTLCCFTYEQGVATIAGLGWVRHITPMGPNHRRADVGMAFIRKPSGNPTMFGRMMAAWSFENLNVDVLNGVTPAPNRAALAFVKRLGFEMAGPLPGGTVWENKLCDVFLSSMTKERWDSISPFKAETLTVADERPDHAAPNQAVPRRTPPCPTKPNHATPSFSIIEQQEDPLHGRA